MNPITLKPGQSVTHGGDVLAKIQSIANGRVRMLLADGRVIEAGEGDQVPLPRPKRRKRDPRLMMPRESRAS